MTTALSGTTTERNTIISSRNETSSTPPKKSGSRSATPRVMSRFAAAIPPTSTVRSVPAVACRDGRVAQRVDQVLGGLVLGRGGGDQREHGGVAGLVDDGRGDAGHAVDLGAAPCPPRRSAASSSVARRALDGEHQRCREAGAEPVGEQVVGLVGGVGRRVVLGVGEPEPHAEEGRRQRQQDGEPADRGEPGPALDEAAPAVPAGGVVGVRVLAHERHVQAFDVAAGEAEQWPAAASPTRPW